MIIEGVNITASGFHPGRDELTEYVHFVKAKAGDVARINVELCEDGMVDVAWTKHNPPFERIRRITGR